MSRPGRDSVSMLGVISGRWLSLPMLKRLSWLLVELLLLLDRLNVAADDGAVEEKWSEAVPAVTNLGRGGDDGTKHEGNSSILSNMFSAIFGIEFPRGSIPAGYPPVVLWSLMPGDFRCCDAFAFLKEVCSDTARYLSLLLAGLAGQSIDQHSTFWAPKQVPKMASNFPIMFVNALYLPIRHHGFVP